MTDKEGRESENFSWQEKVKYWLTVTLIIFVVFFLFVMLFYGYVMTAKCDFIRFITFQCVDLFGQAI